MTIAQCLQMLREIKDVSFASVDAQGNPQVRIIDVMLIEEETLYFCTARGKDFYRQLLDHPQIALTALTKAYQMIRLSGKAQRLSDQKYWIDRIFANNPAMNDVYPGQSRYILEAFCIAEGELAFFDLGKTPIERETLAWGNASLSLKGYHISDACIGCGKCQTLCPQRCIQTGAPYLIDQRHCLHCGLCAETCPMQAIKKRGVCQ